MPTPDLTPSPVPLDDMIEDGVLDDGVPDGDANDRVHHHARVGDDHPQPADGSFATLCGLRIMPRPDAAELPCCPMCGLVMGKPCR